MPMYPNGGFWVYALAILAVVLLVLIALGVVHA